MGDLKILLFILFFFF